MMDEIVMIRDLDKSKLKADTIEKLEKLCHDIYNAPLKNLTSEQISNLLILEINTCITEMTVFCQGTRQVEAYTPNVYSVSQVIVLKNSYQFIKDQIIEISDPNKKIEKYIELKSVMYKMIAFKYHNTEEFLRSLIRESEVKDGIKAMGRFAK